MSIISFRKRIASGFSKYVYIKPETWIKFKIVKKDYLRLLKGVLIISSFSLIMLFAHRQILYFNTYELEYVDTQTNKQIIDALLPIDYKPTLYLPSCMAQMIFNEIKPSPTVVYKREVIPTHDNGIISLDWVNKGTNGANEHNQDKLLVILHGLTGGSEGSYIKEIAQAFSNIDEFKVVVVNYRGISNTPLMTPSSYHAGYIEDIYTAMKHLRSNHPELKCYALGASMGANIFTKLFATRDDFNDYVKGFVSISNPLNCAEVEKRNRGGILDFFLIQRQLRYVEKHHEVLREIIDIDKLTSIKHYRDFDEIVTLKLFGFASVEEYYRESSSLNDVKHLKIPSIFFNARNDKLSPVDTLDLESTFRTNPHIIMVLTRWGGHVCWFHGFFKPERWFIEKIITYVQTLDALQSIKEVRNPLEIVSSKVV